MLNRETIVKILELLGEGIEQMKPEPMIDKQGVPWCDHYEMPCHPDCISGDPGSLWCKIMEDYAPYGDLCLPKVQEMVAELKRLQDEYEFDCITCAEGSTCSDAVGNFKCKHFKTAECEEKT